jgi:hypothetical protein
MMDSGLTFSDESVRTDGAIQWSFVVPETPVSSRALAGQDSQAPAFVPAWFSEGVPSQPRDSPSLAEVLNQQIPSELLVWGIALAVTLTWAYYLRVLTNAWPPPESVGSAVPKGIAQIPAAFSSSRPESVERWRNPILGTPVVVVAGVVAPVSRESLPGTG